MNEAKTILVVDDDLDILEQYSLMLTADGYNVVQASSMAEAKKPYSPCARISRFWIS